MAEGEDPYVFENPAYDDNEGDDDDQEFNRTGPFEPGAASTAYNGGEQYEMQTMMHEQSGRPDDSYEETPLLGAQSESQKAWDALTRHFPNASAVGLETSYSNTGRLQVKMAGFGKGKYPLFTKNAKTGLYQLNPSLTKEIKDSLGKSAGEIIAEDRDSIREQRQRLAEAENQQRQAEALAAERLNQSQEIQNLGQQIERTQARIDAVQEEQGSNLESEAELNRLKQLKKIIKLTLKKRKKN